jgi:O-antigen ligase
MKKHPFGIGAGNWQLKGNQLDPTHLMAHEYPHNLLFEIINEYGLLAGFLLLILIFHVTYTSFAKMINHYNSSSSLYPFLFYLWIFLLFNAMLSGSLNDSRLLFVTASCILIINPLILKDIE